MQRAVFGIAPRSLDQRQRVQPFRLSRPAPGLNGDVVRLARQLLSTIPVACLEFQRRKDHQRLVYGRIPGLAAALAQVLQERTGALELPGVEQRRGVPGGGAVVELEAAELLLERDGPVEALGDDAFEEELEVSDVRKRAGERGNVAELLGECHGLPGVGLRSLTTVLFGGRERGALEDPCAQQVITVGFCRVRAGRSRARRACLVPRT